VQQELDETKIVLVCWSILLIAACVLLLRAYDSAA
jgi:hypothetical protein